MTWIDWVPSVPMETCLTDSVTRTLVGLPGDWEKLTRGGIEDGIGGYRRAPLTVGETKWWRPERRGYTTDRTEAGVYSFREAVKICKSANWDENADVPPETMVPIRAETEQQGGE